MRIIDHEQWSDIRLEELNSKRSDHTITAPDFDTVQELVKRVVTSPAEAASTQTVSPYRSEAEVSALLQQFEEKCDLLQYKMDGWCVWPTLRFRVSRALQNIPFDKVNTQEFTRGDLLGFALRDLLKMASLRRARYFIKTYSSARLDVQDGKKKDIYFDDLLLNLGSYFKLEILNQRQFLADSKLSFVPYDLTTTAIGLLADRLARHTPASKSCVRLARVLSQHVYSELGLREFNPARVQHALQTFVWSKKVYHWLLRRIKPTHLLLAETADLPVTAAAKELHVKVFEFQHGFTSRHFPGNSWSTYAVPYKRSMAIPDKILLYGKHWEKELAAHGFWRDELCSVGSMRLDSYRRVKQGRNNGRRTLLLTTQGIDTDKVIHFMREFLRLANGHTDFDLYIKLHPIYDTNSSVYETAFSDSPHVYVLSASQTPTTLQLLANADLHVSIYSTCHYEAVGLATPTVVLPFTGSENVMGLCHSGHAAVVHSPLELLHILSECGSHSVAPEAAAQYFEPNAVNSIMRELLG